MDEIRQIYRPIVRVGNWYEDVIMENDRWQSYYKRRAMGKLCIQIRQNLNANLLKPVNLTPSSDHIKCGSVIQILAVDRTDCQFPLAVSVTINEADVDFSQKISDKCEVTLASGSSSFVRNSFRITNSENSEDTETHLKYGEDFFLQCVETDKNPLFLYSAPKSICNFNGTRSAYSFKTHGDIHQGLGLSTKSNVCSAYCKWKCEHVDPEYSVEFYGEPVPKNTMVLIKHSLTNKCLAAEKCVIPTLFGNEFGISVHNYKKTQQAQNIWKLKTE